MRKGAAIDEVMSKCDVRVYVDCYVVVARRAGKGLDSSLV